MKRGVRLNQLFIISFFILIIILLLVKGAPVRPMKFIGKGIVKLTIGVLLLFFYNIFGSSLGLHIPINLFTVFISSVLGISGILSLTAIQMFLL